MPGLAYADRVWESTSTTGTGTLTLTGALQDYQTFTSAFVDQQNVYYCLIDGTNWEVGRGTFSSGPDTLSRDTVFSSSNAGALIVLLAGGTVFCDLPAIAVVDRGLAIAFASHAVPQ